MITPKIETKEPIELIKFHPQKASGYLEYDEAYQLTLKNALEKKLN